MNSDNEPPVKKFRNKYRIESARLAGYDYSRSGAYFVTMCTKNRNHYFGKIVAGTMQLSEIGGVANNCWKKIPNHFPSVSLGEWIVMPDHIHGVIFITNIVETQDLASPHVSHVPSLGTIIRGFKIGVTKYIRSNTDIVNLWQPRFHDRVIRNEPELNRITQYIIANPKKWVAP